MQVAHGRKSTEEKHIITHIYMQAIFFIFNYISLKPQKKNKAEFD